MLDKGKIVASDERTMRPYLIVHSVFDLVERRSSPGQPDCITLSFLMLMWMCIDNSKRIQHQIRPILILSTGIISVKVIFFSSTEKKKNVCQIRKIVRIIVKMQNIKRGVVLYFFQRIRKAHTLQQVNPSQKRKSTVTM